MTYLFWNRDFWWHPFPSNVLLVFIFCSDKGLQSTFTLIKENKFLQHNIKESAFNVWQECKLWIYILERLSNWPISNLDFNLQRQYINKQLVSKSFLQVYTSKCSISWVSSFGALCYYFSIMRPCTYRTATYNA